MYDVLPDTSVQLFEDDKSNIWMLAERKVLKFVKQGILHFFIFSLILCFAWLYLNLLDTLEPLNYKTTKL